MSPVIPLLKESWGGPQYAGSWLVPVIPAAAATFCRPEVAKNPFTIGWEFTGPAASSWTMRVAEGACTLAEGRAENPNLRLTMSPETFNIVMIRQAKNPMLAMLRGEMKVKGFSKMGMMKKLFVPDPDKEIKLPGMG